MNCVYIDESGNTGLNLKDPEQPVFVMAALILPESKWFSLERSFLDAAKKYIADPLPPQFEIQAKDLKGRRGVFKNISLNKQGEVKEKYQFFNS